MSYTSIALLFVFTGKVGVSLTPGFEHTYTYTYIHYTCTPGGWVGLVDGWMVVFSLSLSLSKGT